MVNNRATYWIMTLQFCPLLHVFTSTPWPLNTLFMRLVRVSLHDRLSCYIIMHTSVHQVDMRQTLYVPKSDRIGAGVSTGC